MNDGPRSCIDLVLRTVALQAPPLACRAYPSGFSRQQPDVGHDDVDREGEMGRVGGVNELN